MLRNWQSQIPPEMEIMACYMLGITGDIFSEGKRKNATENFGLGNQC